MSKPDLKARAERNGKIRRSIARIEQTVHKLETMKDEYLQKAVDAKSRGDSASYSLAKSGLNVTLTQIKRAREMLLNIEITSELQKMGETNADFLTGMSTIAKRISKINKQSDFVKLQKEIQKALTGMEEAQAGLDGFLQNTDAQFAAISSAPGALSDSEIDALIAGKVSEKELLMDAQIEQIITGGTAVPIEESDNVIKEQVGGSAKSAPNKAQGTTAAPFPPPRGAFDFEAVKSEVPVNVAALADEKSAAAIAMFERSDGAPIMTLGTTESGEVKRISLDNASNMVIGGMIGAGKSALLHSFICSQLVTRSAAEVRFVMFDSERTELTAYNGVPHMSADVITDISGVLPTLAALDTELERRYELFAASGVRNISDYNKLSESRLPYIAVIFDEFSYCMKTLGKEFERAFVKLFRQSAEVGMFAMAATREITQEVLTPALLSVCGATAAFRTGTDADSRTIGVIGAERLTAAGEYVFAADGMAETVLRAPFVTADTVRRIVRAIEGDAI